MAYKCGRCQQEFDALPVGMVRCPNCAHKIFYKVRAPIGKKLIAR
jgi:DNA-directed RNA polymerase subunit RPC12/RpoP